MMVPVLIVAIILIVGAGVMFFSDSKPAKSAEDEKTEDSPVQNLSEPVGVEANANDGINLSAAQLIDIATPGPNKRVCAYLIDLIIIGIVQYFIDDYAISMSVASVLWLLRDSIKGQSMGKKVFGLRVLNQHKKPGGFAASFLRNIPMVVPYVNVIEYFIMRKSEEGKRFGDVIGQTQVEDLRPTVNERKNFLISIPLALIAMVVLAGPFAMQAYDRVQMITEPGTDFVNYYDRALEEYPRNPPKASLLALKAEVFGTYDMMRVSDSETKLAWAKVQENLAKIRRWSLYHPRVYRQNLRDVVRWAKRQSAPSYPPLWIARFGIEAKGQSVEGVELKVGRNKRHDPSKAWPELVESYNYLAEDEVTWRDMAEAIEPEVAVESLNDLKEQLVKAYGNVMDARSIEEFSNHIQQIIDQFPKKSGTVGDKVIAVTDDIDLYLEDVDARVLPGLR